jgi:hypothetical protein
VKYATLGLFHAHDLVAVVELEHGANDMYTTADNTTPLPPFEEECGDDEKTASYKYRVIIRRQVKLPH